MNWFLMLIFVITCYPILFIMYFNMRGAVDKNSYCFGAILKSELKKDPRILEIDKNYRKQLKLATFILAVLPVSYVWMPWFSVTMSLWILWTFAMAFVPMIFYALANRKVIALKAEQGWAEHHAINYADLKIAGVSKRVKLIHFLPSIILSIIPFLLCLFTYEGKYHIFSWVIGVLAFCTLIFYLCALWTDNQKITVICEDSDTNMNYARAKKLAWRNFWLYSAVVNTAFTWSMYLLMNYASMQVGAIMWISVAYSIVILLLCFYLIRRLMAINTHYEDKKTVLDASDDDRNWIWGLIYYNKKDKHMMVENRIGLGTAINVGTTAGLIWEIVGIGMMVLVIPVLCIWMFLIEFTPMDVSVHQDTIICKHLDVEYEILFSDIQTYEVLTELPEMTKLNGTGMSTLYSGTFEIYKEGAFETFLNPQAGMYIKITTKDETYYLSGNDEDMTEELITAIENYIKSK